MTMHRDLQDAMTAYRAFLESGLERLREVPNQGTVACFLFDGEDAVEHLHRLRSSLALAAEQSYALPELRPTADLLATGLRTLAWGREDALNWGFPHAHQGEAGPSRPSAEYVRASELTVLDKAFARLQMVEPRRDPEQPSERQVKSGSPSPNESKETGPVETYHGFASADFLWHDHGIKPVRLSEAKRDGKVRSKPAPAGLKDSQGKSVRILYHVGDALKHCKPKHVKEQTRRKLRGES